MIKTMKYLQQCLYQCKQVGRSQLIQKPLCLYNGIKGIAPNHTSDFRGYSTIGEEPCISRYPVPEKHTLDKEIQNIMNEVEEKTKFLPNVMKSLAHRQEEFKAFFNYYEVLMDKKSGSLTKAEKELIVVATSASNQCLYCVVAHSAIHRIYSKNPYVADQVATNIELANLSSRERSIVNFALKIAHMDPIDENDFATLQQNGLDKEDAWDVGAIAAFFALSNRMAHLTAMRPNEEFYLMGRTKKDK